MVRPLERRPDVRLIRANARIRNGLRPQVHVAVGIALLVPNAIEHP